MPQRPRAYNPQTGQEIEYDGQTWVVISNPATEAIKAQQAATYPTNAELGGFPGMVAPAPNSMARQFGNAMADSLRTTLSGEGTPGLNTGMNDPSWMAMTAATPVPLAKTASTAAATVREALAKALGVSSTRASQNFETVKQAIGSEIGNYQRALPALNEAGMLKSTTRSTIPGPMRGTVAQNILTNQPVTYNEARMAASRAGRLAQKETAATDPMMGYQLKQFARAMDEGNRDLAVKHGVEPFYDAAMKEWGRAENLSEKAAIIGKWGKRMLVAAALGGAGTAGGVELYRALEGGR